MASATRASKRSLVGREVEVGAVEALRLGGSGQAKEHDDGARTGGQRCRLVRQVLVVVGGSDPEAGGEGDLHAVRDGRAQLVERKVDAGGVDL